MTIAERLREEVEEELFPGHEGQFDVKLTMSIGVAAHPHDGGDIDSLIEMADRGLYAAKEAGRNLVRRGGASGHSSESSKGDS